jgi:hypothetical protein
MSTTSPTAGALSAPGFEIEVITGGITIDMTKTFVSMGIVYVFVEGGNLNTTESFTVRAWTEGGRKKDMTFYIKIRNK